MEKEPQERGDRGEHTAERRSGPLVGEIVAASAAPGVLGEPYRRGPLG